MQKSVGRFANMLTEAVYKIRLRESKSIQIIQDEIGHMLGRSGGRTIEYWRQGNAPSKRDDIEKLTQELVRRGRLDASWAKAFVTAAGFAYTDQQDSQLFPDRSYQGETAAPVHTYLPRRPFRQLIGRSEICLQLLRALNDPDGCWIVGVDGIGGIGKTALALEIAAQCVQERRFQHIVWLQAASTPKNSSHQEQIPFTFESILDGVGNQLGVPDVVTLPLPQKRARIQAMLHHSRVLLIIDNLDTATQPQETIIRELEPLLNPSKALLTSRQRFGGEVFTKHLTGLEQEAGIEFVRQDAQEKGVEHLIAADPTHLTQLVNQTGGSPLALKLLVSQLAYLPLDLVLQRLQAVEPLASHDHQYFRFYRTVFFESWALLSEASKKLLISLSNFDPMDGVYLDPIQYVSGLEKKALLPSIDQLWRLSLLEIVEVENVQRMRYALHPLTQYFVSSFITAITAEEGNRFGDQKWEAVYRESHLRFVEFWLRYAVEHAADYQKLDADEKNIFKALDKAPQEDFARSVCALAPYLVDLKGQYARARALLQQVVSRGDHTDSHCHVTAVLYLGRIAEKLGENDLADSLIRQAIDKAQEIGDIEQLSVLYHDLGSLAKAQGRYEEAVKDLQCGLAINPISPTQAIIMLGKLSGVYISQGKWQQASQYLERAFLLESEVKAVQMTPIYNNLGVVKEQLGLYDEANALYTRGLAAAEAAGHLEHTCMFLVNLGHAAQGRGHRGEALTYLRRALEIARQIGHKPAVSVLLGNLGATEYDPDQACAYYAESVEIARELGHQEYLIAGLIGLGERLSMQGQYARAEVYLNEGLEAGLAINHRMTFQIYYIKGEIALNRGQFAAAEAAFQKALEMAGETDDRAWITRIQLVECQLAMKLKDFDRAEALLKLSAEVMDELKNSGVTLTFHQRYGDLELALGDPAAAQRHFERALEIGRQIESREANGLSRFGLARCAAQLGENNKARTHAQQSLKALRALNHRQLVEVEEFYKNLLRVEVDMWDISSSPH